MAQTSALPDPLLLPFLASFEGGALPPLKVGDALLLKWRATETAFQGGANALRYHQGRVLGARLASFPHGERSPFKDEMGELLSLSRRSIELRIQIAGELDLLLGQAGDDAAELRRSVLDRPWRDVLGAVRLALHGPAEPEPESIAPEPPALAEVPPRSASWRDSITAIEDETFDSLDDLDAWVQVLKDALDRAEERREELTDEVTEVPEARDRPVIRVSTTRRPPRWADAESDGLKVSFIRGDGD